MKLYEDIQQGTEEWLKLRAGKFTASKDFQQLVTGKADTYAKLIRRKAAERITGQPVSEKYTNLNMERGKEIEQEAVNAFEMETGLSIDRVAFVESDNGFYGASPDGLIGKDSGIEIKGKDVHTHLDCFIDGYDKSYDWQIQGSLYVTGRKYWYFVSYNPHYAHINKHLFVQKIERNEEKIFRIEHGLKKGIAAVKQLIEEQTKER